MKAPDKPRGKKGLLTITGISTFQEKCEVLRDAFFPPMSLPPPPFPANWPAPPIIDTDNTYKSITATEIQDVLQKSSMDSATAKDNVSYRIISAT